MDDKLYIKHAPGLALEIGQQFSDSGFTVGQVNNLIKENWEMRKRLLVTKAPRTLIKTLPDEPTAT